MKTISCPSSRLAFPWLLLAACLCSGISDSLRAATAAPLAVFSEGSFDGRNVGFTLGQKLPAQLPGDFTIELTVRPAATQETYADIIDFNHRANLAIVIQQNQDDTNNFIFAIGNGAAGNAITHRLQAGVWQRVVFQREGAQLRLYVDGALVATQPCFAGAISYLPDSDATIGYNKTYGRHFKGDLKDVAVWAGARPPTLSPDETSPIAAYSSGVFDGNSGGSALGTNITPRLEDDFTIELTVRPGAPQQTYADIIDFNHRANLAIVIQQNQDDTNSFIFAIGNGTTGSAITHRLQAGVWQRIIFQREGTQLRLYVDGALVATQPCFLGKIAFLPDSNVTVGYNANYGRHFRGEIQDLRIWNCARKVGQGSSATSALPDSGRPVTVVQTEIHPSGQHYYVINYTGDTQNRHDFLIDFGARTVRELNQPTEKRDQTLTVSIIRPKARLIMRTQIGSTGYWIEYDWVFLDDGRTIAGCYRDRGSSGPSVGGVVP